MCKKLYFVLPITCLFNSLPTSVIFKHCGPRSGTTKCRAWSRSKLFDTLVVFLFRKNFSKKLILKKISRRQKSIKNYPVGKELNTNVFVAVPGLGLLWYLYIIFMICLSQDVQDEPLTLFPMWNFPRFFVACWLFSQSTSGPFLPITRGRI